jgi:hypothetical protein
MDLLRQVPYLPGEFSDLAGQVRILLQQRECGFRDLFPVTSVGIGPGLVTIGLPRLGEQDEGCGVSSLGAEGEVEENGYGSQRRAMTAALTAIQARSSTVGR